MCEYILCLKLLHHCPYETELSVDHIKLPFLSGPLCEGDSKKEVYSWAPSCPRR